MASQISHIVYADQYLMHNPRPKSKEDFITGVLFPDIRRISNLTRQQTHQHFEKLDLRFSGLSSFEAGWKFHVWCDLRRNELLRDAGFFDIKAVEKFHYLAYHFLEDQLLWGKSGNWETIHNIIIGHEYIRLFPELRKDDWRYWYEIVGEYIQSEPTPESIGRFCKAQPSLATKAGRIIDEMQTLRKNKKVVEILSGIYEKMLKVPGSQ